MEDSKMSLPSISIINFSANLDDQQVQDVIRAINRQITEDYLPVWGHGRILRMHAPTFDVADEDTLAEDPVRGDSVIYLVDEATLEGALGFHSLNALEVPFGFVFTEFGDDWTVTLSHEALELITDPTANILVPGPDPRDPENQEKVVLHAYESCDAVERTSYEIDGIRVSNFVTPTYFSPGDAAGTRNDFLGVGVSSFGATPDSHVAFFDLDAGEWVTFFGDAPQLMAVQVRRAATFAVEYPSRPADKSLQQVLARCQKEHKPLRRLRAVSRPARYRDAALRMVGKASF
jgi:hypothetical protein